jgi:hypothetical protein
LGAAIGVGDELEVGSVVTLPQGHPQGVEDEVGTHVGGGLPADDLAAEGVDHEGEVADALPGAQVGEVADPEPVRPWSAEVALDQVGPAGGLRVGRCGAPGLTAPLGALDSCLAHQPLHAAATDLLARPAQGDPGAPVAVGAVVGLVDLLDPGQQALVFDRPV